jgi:AcrR family transcriptional regulator
MPELLLLSPAGLGCRADSHRAEKGPVPVAEDPGANMSRHVDTVNTLPETLPVPDSAGAPTRSADPTTGAARHGDRSSGSRRGDDDDRRDLGVALIGAAVELVETSGARGLSWREVARRADVSHSAAYRHFENKEGLLAAVAEHGFRELAERMRSEAAASPGGAAHHLEAMAIAYVEFAGEKPSHFRVMFGRDVPDIARYPALEEAHDAAIDLFRSAVRGVLADVGGVAAELDADQFALMGWSLVHGLASLIVDGRVGDVADGAMSPAEQVRSMTGIIELLLLGRGGARSSSCAPSNEGEPAPGHP